MKIQNKKNLFSKFLDSDSVILKQDANESTVIIYSKTLNLLIQELINMLVERQFFFEVFSNFKFNNSILKKQDTLQFHNELGFFNSQTYFKLDEHLYDKEEMNLRNENSQKKMISSLRAQNNYHYLEFQGALFGNSGIQFLT